MFESHKLSEVMSALLSGLISNAQEHSRLRPRLSCAEPASGDLPALRMGSEPRDPGLRAPAWGGGGLPGVGRPDARGFPFSLGNL